MICFAKRIQTDAGNESNTTNNRMELTAIIKAIQKIIYLKTKNKDFESTTFTICSDSAYCINAINNGWITKWRMNEWTTQSGENVKNQDLWKEFLRLYCISKEYITFKKVKGHSGNPQNELADRLAKDAIVQK